MRKKIAVFICAISFSSQKRILEGILQESKKSDFDVFIFTCHVNHSASYMKINGAFSVMMLPDFADFDGVIIMKGTIRQDDIANALVNKIKSYQIPAVSIEEEIEGMHYVGISDYDAQKKVINHLIETHNAKHICYVTGVLESDGGRARYRAFQDAMREHNLIYQNEDVYIGNYIGESGRLAIKQFLSTNTKVDAIVCANDGMAFGVIDELVMAGYRVPEDILVTGFDNDTYSRYSVPMLTTLDQNQEEIGRIAVSLLKLPKEKGCIRKIIESDLILGESCGCIKEVSYSIEEVRKTYSKEIGIISQAVDTTKNMSIELAELTTLEDLYKRLPKYVERSDMEEFFLCIEDGDYLEVPLAYQRGNFFTIPAYQKGTVLPDSVRDSDMPQFYVATSLFFGERNFGYIIQGGSRFALESELAYSWVVNIGVAMENIAKIRIMQEMVDKLNAMWMYDTLTNLYNRGGFYHCVAPLLDHIKDENGKCYLMFFDLDGLKKVNDNLGHEIGDQYIVSMAKSLRNTIRRLDCSNGMTPIAMRYGGDEFVLFGQCKSPDDTTQIIEIIDQEIKQINEKSQVFELSYSVGLSILDATEIDDLNSFMEEADKKMYESKKSKRQSIS